MEEESSYSREVIRSLERMQEIKGQIAWHMRSEVAQELIIEHDTLERQVLESPDYRVYFFKRRYNLLSINEDSVPASDTAKEIKRENRYSILGRESSG